MAQNKKGRAFWVGLTVALLIIIAIILAFFLLNPSISSKSTSAGKVSVREARSLLVSGGAGTGELIINHYAVSEGDDEEEENETINDTIPPAAVTNLAAGSIGTNFIYWSWTNPSDSDFAYNIIYLNGNNVANTSNNYYNATGLSPSTTYTIIINTRDTHGNINGTNINNSQTTNPLTGDTTPPGTITNLHLDDKGLTYIIWGWSNPTDSDFAENIVYLDGNNVVNTTSSNYTASGLAPSSSHTINVHTKDTSGNVNNTDVSDTQITNAVDLTPPGTVTNLRATEAGTNNIRWQWTNPSDPDFSEAILYLNGNNVANITLNSYNFTGLTANTSYTIIIHTKDTSGNINNTDVSNTNRTLPLSGGDVTPPVISNVQATSITNVSATITWTTNEGSNSIINYGLTNSLGTVVTINNNVIPHSVPTGVLNANTTYYYNVTSCDGSLNCATAGTRQFTTAANPNPPVNQPPVASNVNVVTNEDNSVAIQLNATDADSETLTYALASSPTNGLITGFSPSAGTLTYIPNANYNGTDSFTYTASDASGTSNVATVSITINAVNDAASWLTLSNQNINEDSAIGTIVYSNIVSRCADIDSPKVITAAPNTNFTLGMSGNNLILNSITHNWYGSENVQLSCNGISSSFTLTVNHLLDDCVTICSYGRCYTYCD